MTKRGVWRFPLIAWQHQTGAGGDTWQAHESEFCKHWLSSTCCESNAQWGGGNVPSKGCWQTNQPAEEGINCRAAAPHQSGTLMASHPTWHSQQCCKRHSHRQHQAKEIEFCHCHWARHNVKNLMHCAHHKKELRPIRCHFEG